MPLGVLVVILIGFGLGLMIPRIRKPLWSAVGALQAFASGEFFLTFRPNGGDVVLVRSIWTAALLFVAAIGVSQRLEAGATWVFSPSALRSGATEHVEWLGALLAAAYAVYYSRFAAQWTYLAGLYNQIMGLRAQTGEVDTWRAEIYAKWWAAFIEDAQDVHLALKPSYAALIHGLLEKPGVREAYVNAALRGPERIARLERRLASVLRDHGGFSSAVGNANLAPNPEPQEHSKKRDVT